jgi:hypothetical protein
LIVLAFRRADDPDAPANLLGEVPEIAGDEDGFGGRCYVEEGEILYVRQRLG